MSELDGIDSRQWLTDDELDQREFDEDMAAINESAKQALWGAGKVFAGVIVCCLAFVAIWLSLQ